MAYGDDYNSENMLTVGWRLNTSVLDFYNANAKAVLIEATRMTVDSIKADIQSSWSGESPSEPGTPPATVSGYLNDSIKVIRRDSAGRFSVLDSAVAWTLTVESEYGAAQEYGRPEINLAPRPYLRPALARANTILKQNVIQSFKFMEQRRATGFKEYWSEFGVLPQLIGAAFKEIE